MPAHRKPGKPTTAAGLPIAAEPVKAAADEAVPSKLAQYAKAVAAFLGAELVAISAWGLALPDGPIHRSAWFGLAAAVAGPVLVAGGVAAIENAKKPADAGHSSLGVILFVVAVLLIFGFGFALTKWLLFLLIVALLLLLI